MNFEEKISQLKKINPVLLLKQVIQLGYVQDTIIMMNQAQLKNEGKRSTGEKIVTYAAAPGKVYSEMTIRLKQLKNQPTDRVTLYDTGMFYKTFVVAVSDLYAEIQADFQVHGESIARRLRIGDILGLTDDNLLRLIWNVIYPLYVEKLRIAAL